MGRAGHRARQMSFNTFGRIFRFSTWGESPGPAIGAVVDGCPPGLALSAADIQPFLDQRRPGPSKFTTQRQEPDHARILAGVRSDERRVGADCFRTDEYGRPPA